MQAYLRQIKYRCLVMSEGYIRRHYDDIRKYASTIEERLDDSYCAMETLLRDNEAVLKKCQDHGVDYILIDDAYCVDMEL